MQDGHMEADALKQTMDLFFNGACKIPFHFMIPGNFNLKALYTL